VAPNFTFQTRDKDEKLIAKTIQEKQNSVSRISIPACIEK
jgi:hypothetical protein